MASIRTNKPARGPATYSVLFRQGGAQKSRTFATKQTAKRLVSLIDAVGPDRALRLLAEETGDRNAPTVDQLAAQWLEWKLPRVTPRVGVGYERDYRNWIKPRLGARTADYVTEYDVQEWVDWMVSTGELSPKSIADRHAILHGIFAWASAKARRIVSGNPCLETDLPKRKKKPPKGLRLPELYRLLDAGDRVDRDAADLVAFMAGTGWRIGEAIAPTAASFEDDGERLYVRMDRVFRRGAGFVDGAKSEASHGRRLRVFGPAVARTRRRLVGLGPNELVFTRDGQPWAETTFRDRRWPLLVAEAGLADRKPTPHWLRHTHVALCHTAGLSMAEIQRRLGHEDIRTTINTYGGMIDDMSDESADRLDALLMGPVVSGEVVVAQPLELPGAS